MPIQIKLNKEIPTHPYNAHFLSFNSPIPINKPSVAITRPIIFATVQSSPQNVLGRMRKKAFHKNINEPPKIIVRAMNRIPGVLMEALFTFSSETDRSVIAVLLQLCGGESYLFSFEL